MRTGRSRSLGTLTTVTLLTAFIGAPAVVLTTAATAIAATASTVPVTVPLTSYADNQGIDGSSDHSGNFDGAGYSFPAEMMPPPGVSTVAGVPYLFPDSAAGNDNVVALGQTITLPQGTYSTADLLVSASYGSAGGNAVIHYSNGTTATEALDSPDWYGGPTGAIEIGYRSGPDGANQQHSVNMYTEQLALDSTRTATSITLPTTGLPAPTTPSLHIFALTLQSTAAQTVTDFYVATDGSDSHSGTSAAPFATIARAQQAVRSLLPTATGPINVEIEAGTYYLGQTLTFGPQDSGTAATPVTYTAYDGQNVTISGGRALHPSWSTYSGNSKIMVASVGTGLNFDQLFMNQQRQILARYPNYNAANPQLDGTTTLADLNAETASWTNVTTGDVRAMQCDLWGGDSYKIAGRNSDGTLDLSWVGDNNRGNCIDTSAVMIEGVFQALDSPGEWYYNSSTGDLYFYPPAGTDLATATFQTAELNELIRVQGTSPTDPVRNLTFTGLHFTDTHRTLFNTPYVGLQLGDWAVARVGAVHLIDTQDITVQNSTFDQLGGNAVFIDGYNSTDVVTDDHFTDVGATDVNVVGSEAAVRDASTWADEVTTLTDTTPGPQTQDYPRDITVSYNDMAGNGAFEEETAGVNISMSHNVTVSHNTIYDSPRSCVNINDGTWGGDDIEYNDIFDCVQGTADHGPINAWGRDRFWPLTGGDALQHEYATLDVVDPDLIHDNRIWHNNEWDIDLDDGSSNYKIYNNLLLNGGIKLRDGFYRTVQNNILVGGSTYEQVSHANNGDLINHNITLAAQPYNLTDSNPLTAKYTVDDNLFWYNGTGVTLPGGWTADGLDTHSVTANPQFNGGSPWTTPAMTDYSVAATSPALGLGFANFSMTDFGDPGSPTSPPVNDLTPPPALTVTSQPEPLMGATVTSIYDAAIQTAVGLGNTDGVYLQTVPTGSSAQTQGLEANDVIQSINGTTVTDRDSFWTVYNALRPGAQLTLGIWRNQAALTLTVTKPAAGEELNDTAGVVYTGTSWSWKDSTTGGGGSFQNDIYSTTNIGDSFSFTFNGTGISYISETYSDEGQVAIYIDGTYKTTINCDTSTRAYQQTVYSITGLSAGVHTIKGVMTTGTYMIVDAFTTHP
jgi:hypothetical protein